MTRRRVANPLNCRRKFSLIASALIAFLTTEFCERPKFGEGAVAARLKPIYS